MSAELCGDKPKRGYRLRLSALSSLKPRLQWHPKRPEPLDLGKQAGYFARGKHDGSRDFAADQPVDRAGFYFAEPDFGGSRRHQRGADASARCGLLLRDRDGLVVQV